MATFTTEEIELLKNRGNDYCKRVWLGLYEGNPPTECRDEQAVRDFMINKYERKRYYLDPSQALRNGYVKPEPTKSAVPETKPLKSLIADPKPLRVNGNLPTDNHRKRPESNSHKNHTDFVADFDKADIFSSCNNSNNNNKSSNGVDGVQGGFANFDNNPIFENGTSGGMPTPVSLSNMNQQQNMVNKAIPPPPEDKYAALKDLDNALKTQSTFDWSSSNGSSSSLYSSPTPTGSMYSSSSPQSSIFGSPSQGQFMGVFPVQENGVANPFTNGMNWQNSSNGMMGAIHQQPYVNPFRSVDVSKMNGFTPSFQPAMYPYENVATTWTANPFKVGAAANMKSNNPFL